MFQADSHNKDKPLDLYAYVSVALTAAHGGSPTEIHWKDFYLHQSCKKSYFSLLSRMDNYTFLFNLPGNKIHFKASPFLSQH